MDLEPKTQTAQKVMYWAGWVVSVVPCLMLFMSAFFKLTRAEMAVKGFADAGYPPDALLPIGVTELLSTILYLIPQTSVLGAILLTGYLGGAANHHVRLGEPFLIPVGLGVLLWLGLFLRDARIRALIPWRK